MLLRTDNVLLTQVSRLPSCVSGEGVVLCSGAPMGTLVVAHSVGTVSTSDLAVARLYRQGPGSKSESFSVGRGL